jgi:hypothetical protein
MPDTEPKPCGFCGKPPRIESTERWTIIDCQHCRKRVYERCEFPRVIDGAVKIWNERYGQGK